MATTTFDLYNLMERDNVLLAFKGTVTSDLLSSVFQIMESKMEDLNDSPATKRRFLMFWLNVCRTYTII